MLCGRCGKDYEYKKHSNTKEFCTSCLVNFRRFNKKELLVQAKGGCCNRCGYNESNRALSFHHLDPSKKDFTISGKHCHKMERLLDEIDKCILLCLNCHASLHDKVWVLTQEMVDKFNIKSNWIKNKEDILLKNKHDKVAKNATYQYIKKGREHLQKFHIEKEVLAKLLWEKPTSQIALMYGVSDNAIAKRARRWGLTKPHRGYWTWRKFNPNIESNSK